MSILVVSDGRVHQKLFVQFYSTGSPTRPKSTPTTDRPKSITHAPHRAPTKADYIHFADISGHVTRPVTQPTISGAFGGGECRFHVGSATLKHLHVIKLSRIRATKGKFSRYGVGRGSLVTVTGSDVKLRISSVAITGSAWRSMEG